MNGIRNRNNEKSRNTRPELFVVSPVTFEEGKADPFGFDDLVEKIGGYYVPIAAAVKRIRYFVFIPFVNVVLQDLKAGPHERRVMRRRLDKLFVYLSYHQYNLGKNSGLIGNSLVEGANPFVSDAGTWVQNDCFKIYTNNSLSALGTREEKFAAILRQYTLREKHVAFVKAFLSREGPSSRNKSWLGDQKSAYRGSVFDYSRPLPRSFYKYFLKQLKNNDQVMKLTQHYEDLFAKPALHIAKIKKDRVHFPFADLNQFLSSVVIAINADLEGEDASHAWNMAYANYNALLQRHRRNISHVMAKNKRLDCWYGARSVDELRRGLYEAAAQHVSDWFDFIQGRFAKGPDFGRYKEQWEGISSRAESGTYSDYRLNALEAIITDSNLSERI